jgi:hypothetical protein
MCMCVCVCGPWVHLHRPCRSLEELSSRYSEVTDRLIALDASTAESRASSILSGLQFSVEMQAMPTKALSGGWRMRCVRGSAVGRARTWGWGAQGGHLVRGVCVCGGAGHGRGTPCSCRVR